MIKVEDLEKHDKLKNQKKTKVENQKISRDIKPKKPAKMPKIRPQRASPDDSPEMPQKKYVEYRSILTPALGGIAWQVYKQMQDNPSISEYNQIMSSIVTSPDINELIHEQLTYFDSTDGLLKALATCAAKLVETSTIKLVNNQEAASVTPASGLQTAAGPSADA